MELKELPTDIFFALLNGRAFCGGSEGWDLSILKTSWKEKEASTLGDSRYQKRQTWEEEELILRI